MGIEVVMNMDGLLDLEDEGLGEDLRGLEAAGYESLSEKSLVEKDKVYLGLDVSLNSTGICLYVGGERKTFNCSEDLRDDDPHWEVTVRRGLQKDILEALGGLRELDLVVIEDVFEGENPQTARVLYALNSAIDELIVDGKIVVKDFIRVHNQRWKKWLFVVDSLGELKGMKDKLKIEKCLSLLGVEETGEGYQDRLDATGMLLGYLLECKTSKEKVSGKIERRVLVPFEDLVFTYEEDQELALMLLLDNYDGENGQSTVVVDDRKITKEKMRSLCTDDLVSVFVTAEPVRLGTLGGQLGVRPLQGGGYFAFRVKERARARLRKKGFGQGGE